MDHVPAIYETSRTLNRVEEVMTDLILCELAGTEPQFIEAVADHFGLSHPSRSPDRLAEKIAENGAEVVIPPKRNRKVPHTYDVDLYKERNRIERFFSKLKHFRRVATRYDKLLANFMGFVKLAAIAVWLR